MTRSIILSALTIPFIFAVGCSDSEPKKYPVRGVVRFPDGKLLRQGSVEFEYLDAQPPHMASGEIQPDGSFILGTMELDDGAVAGKYRAVVISYQAIGNGAERPGLIAKSQLHPKYRDFRKAKLEYVIEPKVNNIVINVEYAPQVGDDKDQSATDN